MPTVRAVIYYLQQNYSDLDCIACPIWTEDDVIDKATQMNLVLTQQQVEDVLEEIDDEHNPSVGINWDILETAIREIAK